MDQITDQVHNTVQPQKGDMTAADHFRTADMHRACATVALAAANGQPPAEDGEPTPDPWLAQQKFENHLRLADLHTALAQARVDAVGLLMRDREYRTGFGEMLTPQQASVIDHELKAWGHALAPLPITHDDIAT